jgi:hypothetical protein
VAPARVAPEIVLLGEGSSRGGTVLGASGDASVITGGGGGGGGLSAWVCIGTLRRPPGDAAEAALPAPMPVVVPCGGGGGSGQRAWCPTTARPEGSMSACHVIRVLRHQGATPS